MAQTSLPAARAPFVEQDGRPTPQFYRFIETLATAQTGNASASDIAAINAQLAALQAEIDALPESSGYPKLQVTYPILSQGLLQNGFAKLAMNQPGDSGTGSLLAFVKDAWGRIIGTKAATITGTAGRVTVANGDASAGLPTIDLAMVTDTGGGSLLRIVRDAWGRVAGTSAPAVADLKGAGLVVPQGYIDGLQMQWVSGTAVTVSSGAAYIPALGNVLQSSAAIALSGLTLSASTWYHLYLYSNAGTPAVECVTTAPVLYHGTSYQKTGDNTRRYIGSVKTDASGNIFSFYHESATGNVHYRVDLNTAGFQIVINGTATTDATVQTSAVVPTTARTMLAFAENNATSGVVYIGNADCGTPVNTHILAFIRANRTLYGELQLTSSQTFTYMVSSPAGLSCYCAGYRYER